MDCQSCGKAEATVVITRIAGEKHQVVHLCRACAGTFSAPGSITVTVQTGATPPTVEPGPACPGCGTGFEEVMRSGLFGCAACYDAFSSQLPGLFRRVQGVDRHASRPGDGDPQAIALLEERLRKAVAEEAFEEAAAIRDRLQQVRGAVRDPSQG
jgi:protein arginine kinase activator